MCHPSSGLGEFKTTGFILLNNGGYESLLNYNVVMSFSFCVGKLGDKAIPKVMFLGHICYFRIF